MTPIFLLENASKMAETNFTPKNIEKKFNGHYLAKFTQPICYALQKKCKICFGGPRMILHAH